VEQNPDPRGYLFYGRYKLTIDEKNRLLVPASVRRTLDPDRDGSALFMVVGQNEKLWFYPDKYYQRIALQYRSGLFVNEDLLDFKLLHFGMSERLEWDRQGRMVIPDDALQSAGLSRDVTLVGADDHLELWDRQDWDASVPELSKRRREILLKAEQAHKEA
jgi:MraZ protein